MLWKWLSPKQPAQTVSRGEALEATARATLVPMFERRWKAQGCAIETIGPEVDLFHAGLISKTRSLDDKPLFVTRLLTEAKSYFRADPERRLATFRASTGLRLARLGDLDMGKEPELQAVIIFHESRFEIIKNLAFRDWLEGSEWKGLRLDGWLRGREATEETAATEEILVVRPHKTLVLRGFLPRMVRAVAALRGTLRI